MKAKTKKLLAVLVLIVLGLALIGTVYARAATSDEIGAKWWRMNKSHEGAEICRALGWENGTAEQRAAIAEFGKEWTKANNERKELEAAATPSPSPKLEYLGNYQLTAYEYGTGPNAYGGGSPTINYTVASDSIPGGTKLYIEGYGEYLVQDRGVGNSYTIDIFLGDPDTCRQFGRKYNVPVYKIVG